MYMENALNHIVNYEKTIFDKKIIWKVQHGASKSQESLLSENLREC